MRVRWILLFCVLGLGLAVSSCQKLESETMPSVFRVELAKLHDAIPAEYGSLVAVTTDAAYEGWAQLWFEKPDKSVVVVCVDYIRGKMRPSVVTIPRK